MSIDFNNDFFEDLGQSEPVTRMVVDAAERIAEQARADAPSASGDYKRGITVNLVRRKKLRNVAYVVATDPKSLVLESKLGILARALRKAARRG